MEIIISQFLMSSNVFASLFSKTPTSPETSDSEDYISADDPDEELLKKLEEKSTSEFQKQVPRVQECLKKSTDLSMDVSNVGVKLAVDSSTPGLIATPAKYAVDTSFKVVKPLKQRFIDPKMDTSVQSGADKIESCFKKPNES